jgi:dTDP-4-amino-4,6-dideoxygalactose transaminase
MINVTKTYLPPKEEYISMLEGIWESAWVTNFGPLVQQLEKKLNDQLGVRHLFFTGNGTIALQIAIRALDLKKEIITTPFSYAATTSSIFWEGCIPVFADIDRETLCIDPDEIEKNITPNTQAILATHVYGNSCDISRINQIAERHNIKVIYDAAHCFGTTCDNRSILNFGDISAISFHATKLFHTGEGGAIITNNDEVAHRISYLMNFGHNGPEEFFGPGINGKNSELHAAMGLCVLPRIPALIERRKKLFDLYDSCLNIPELIRPVLSGNITYNYAYNPFIFPSENKLLEVKKALEAQDIYPRRYFYPSLSRLPYVNGGNVPVAEDIAPRILCLPLYHDLDETMVEKIAAIIRKSF